VTDDAKPKQTPPPPPLRLDDRKRIMSFLESADAKMEALHAHVNVLQAQLGEAAGWSSTRDKVNTAILLLILLAVVALVGVEILNVY